MYVYNIECSGVHTAHASYLNTTLHLFTSYSPSINHSRGHIIMSLTIDGFAINLTNWSNYNAIAFVYQYIEWLSIDFTTDMSVYWIAFKQDVHWIENLFISHLRSQFVQPHSVIQ